MTDNVLLLEGVSVHGPVQGEWRELVIDCSLTVAAGEAVGLVGESGSGKSLSARAVAGLLPRGFEHGGRIELLGQSLETLSPNERRRMRALHLGMVFQTPRAYLNPLRTIGDFMTEALVTVGRTKEDQALKIAADLLDEVGIDDPYRRMHQRPGQLSGGLLQRVMIGAALAMDPQVLIADEMTTALDVTTQEEVMALVAELRAHRNVAMLFITHDIALARSACDRISVMQAGRIVEEMPAALIGEAKHPYTQALVGASSRLEALGQARAARPQTPVLRVKGLRKEFSVRSASGWRQEKLVAVDDVSFDLRPGQALGIVGESGSGKSTTANIICGLERATGGEVFVEDESWAQPVESVSKRRGRARMVQMVFQDPYQSLDKRYTVRATLAEAVRIRHRTMASRDVDVRVASLMEDVGLDPALADRRPKGLSGGQRQRVAIARALAAEPAILVLDEAVSALDVTAQAEVLGLLDAIRHRTGVALLMISHDLHAVRQLCDAVVVMHNGRVEEQGPIEQVLGNPQAEYTRRLIDSIPREGWVPRRRRVAAGRRG